MFWIVFDFCLFQKMDQRICIKFCVVGMRPRIPTTPIANDEATYLGPKQRLSVVQNVFRGREDVNDEERTEHPSTSTQNKIINKVRKIVLTNRRITVREVAEVIHISISSCHSLFTNNLGIRRVAAKFVPKLLNFDQKQHCINIVKKLLNSVGNDPNLLQRVIIGDKSWIYGYDMEIKTQSFQWKLSHESRPSGFPFAATTFSLIYLLNLL